VNSFDLKTLLVCAAIKLRYRSRVKLVHHLISLWEDVQLHQRAALWTALRCADRILCNGYAVKERVLGTRRLQTPSLVIPNGVDCEYFHCTTESRSEARATLGFLNDQFVLGTVANVRPVKNYPFLLGAMRELAGRYPHVRLLCVGDGPQLKQMKALAESIGIGGNVLFTGLVRDVRSTLAAMDTFVLCSSNEGNPNVVLQAMAMGIPVVSSSVGEVPNVVHDGVSGLLFQPGDTQRFLSCVAQLVDDEHTRRRIAEAGRARAEAMYSLPQMVARYAALMRDAAG
jgi:glycosyltransferase involved in cell wall biosynthesis